MGLALGGRGSSRKSLINISFVLFVGLLILQFFNSISFGTISLVIGIILTYLIALILNKKYKGLDVMNNQNKKFNAEKFIKEIRKES